MDIQQEINTRKTKVFFFSKEDCHYCDELNKLLTTLCIPFEKITLYDQSDRESLVRITNKRTFPQLFFGDVLIGGFSEFEKLCYTNTLEEKLSPLGIKPNLDF